MNKLMLKVGHSFLLQMIMMWSSIIISAVVAGTVLETEGFNTVFFVAVGGIGALLFLKKCEKAVAQERNKEIFESLKNQWTNYKSEAPVDLVLLLSNGKEAVKKCFAKIYERTWSKYSGEIVYHFSVDESFLDSYNPETEYKSWVVYSPCQEAHRQRVRLKDLNASFDLGAGEMVIGLDVIDSKIHIA